MTTRRTFITLLGGAAAWPQVASTQQTAVKSTIGFLGAATPTVASHWFATSVQRLRELGWIEGRNVTIEVRSAEERDDRAAEIAAEFARLKVDIIATWATAPALAGKSATSTIPIVFALATDPIGSGLVASLARPGGNATGLSLQNIDLAGKRLELLREVVPDPRRLAIMANVGCFRHGRGDGTKFKPSRARSASRSQNWKFGARRILRRLSRRQRLEQMHFLL